MDENKRTIDSWQDEKPYVEDKKAKQAQKTRDIVERCFADHPDWTAKQIAEETGVTPSTVSYHLACIRKEKKGVAEMPAEAKPAEAKPAEAEQEAKEEAEPVNIMERIEKNVQAVQEMLGDKPKKEDRNDVSLKIQTCILRSNVEMLRDENEKLRKALASEKTKNQGINDNRTDVNSRIAKLKDVIVEMCIEIYGGRG